MKRALITTLTFVSVVAMCAAPAIPTASAAKPQLCKHEKCGGTEGAWELSLKDAKAKWASEGWAKFAVDECEGPFENKKGATQWACKGEAWYEGDIAGYWQINLDPYGAIVYSHAP